MYFFFLSPSSSSSFPRFCRMIKEGKVKIVAGDYPSFLFKRATYDPKRLDHGMVRGSYLLRVRIIPNVTSHQPPSQPHTRWQIFRHLFTGGRTALKLEDGTESGRTPVAFLYGLTKVTPPLIAYTATLVSPSVYLSNTCLIHFLVSLPTQLTTYVGR